MRCAGCELADSAEGVQLCCAPCRVPGTTGIGCWPGASSADTGFIQPGTGPRRTRCATGSDTCMPLAPRTENRDAGEWTHLIKADQIPPNGEWMTLSPDSAQRSAIAARIGVEEVQTLHAQLHLIPHQGGHVVEVRGNLNACLTQMCVRTLTPMTTNVAEEIAAWFADYDAATSPTRANLKARRDRTQNMMEDLQFIKEEQDDPEPMSNGQIDLADLVQQFLSLGLNPYPVAGDDGTQTANHAAVTTTPLPDRHQNQTQSPIRQNPFHLLKNWRPKD